MQPEGWRLRVKAYGGAYRDEDNWVGAVEGATDGIDRIDWHEPPPTMGPEVRLYFTNEEGTPHSCDYRAPGEEAYRFEMVVESEEVVSVQVDGVDRLSTSWHVFMIDESTQERHDVRRSCTWVIPGLGKPSSRRLMLWVGEVSGHTQSAAPLPTSYRLFLNIPNPFNRCTVLRYALPEAGSVRLKVYGIDGRLVRTLVQERQEAGWHQVG